MSSMRQDRPLTITVDGNVEMTTCDGIALRAGVYRPDDGAPERVIQADPVYVFRDCHNECLVSERFKIP